MGKELRDWYVQHGICASCGQEKAAPNRKECFACLEKRAERNMKYYHSMSEEQKQARNEKLRKQYAERKAAGKCTRCGKKPAASGRAVCVMCAKRDANRQMKKRRENGVLPKYMFGDGYHCVTCGKDIDNEKKQCDKCYRNSVHALEIARGKIKGGFRSHRLALGKAAKETKESERKRKEENL